MKWCVHQIRTECLVSEPVSCTMGCPYHPDFNSFFETPWEPEELQSSTQTAKTCTYHSEINGGLCLKSGDGCDSPFSECGYAIPEEVKDSE